VHVTDSESWQRIYRIMSENSRWGLSRVEVDVNLVRSFEYIMDLLERLDRSEGYQYDPSGDEALRLAKRLRRTALRRGGDPFVREEAERHFGLPPTALRHAESLEIPLYPDARDVNN
jgi:hypothetical protein